MIASAAPIAVTEWHAAELGRMLQPVAHLDGVSCVVLADRVGRVLAAEGAPAGVDLETLAMLAAAEFSANEQLSRVVGDSGFHTVAHRGTAVSMDVEDVGGRALLITLFGGAPPGLIRRGARELAAELQQVVQTMVKAAQLDTGELQPLAGAEEEIDRMFDW